MSECKWSPLQWSWTTYVMIAITIVFLASLSRIILFVEFVVTLLNFLQWSTAFLNYSVYATPSSDAIINAILTFNEINKAYSNSISDMRNLTTQFGATLMAFEDISVLFGTNKRAEFHRYLEGIRTNYQLITLESETNVHYFSTTMKTFIDMYPLNQHHLETSKWDEKLFEFHDQMKLLTEHSDSISKALDACHVEEHKCMQKALRLKETDQIALDLSKNPKSAKIVAAEFGGSTLILTLLRHVTTLFEMDITTAVTLGASITGAWNYYQAKHKIPELQRELETNIKDYSAKAGALERNMNFWAERHATIKSLVMSSSNVIDRVKRGMRDGVSLEFFDAVRNQMYRLYITHKRNVGLPVDGVLERKLDDIVKRKIT